MYLRIALLFTALIFSTLAFSQGFNFSCAQNITLNGCSTSCLTLKATIPDIRTATNTYAINPLSNSTGCFAPYVQPNDIAGASTNIVMDDRYSQPIDVGFNFPFFGMNNNQVVVSGNGMLSFDISKAGLAAHFSLLNTGAPQDLPYNRYDKSIIMGVYQDLDPAKINYSPGLRIQTQIFGTAPYRRFILSFYKIPLYGGACNQLIENTSQIILYESTGIVEVFVFSKETCTTSNQGRAMIGIQDHTRTVGYMPPGRRASDPPWGGINLNESWRFVPNQGNSLLKRVELLDLSGNIVATGSTITAGNGNLEASFPNICPTSNSTYIVKSVYEKIDDPSQEVFGQDTIRVSFSAGANLSVTPVVIPLSCAGASDAQIRANVNGTASYQYKLDAGNWQSSNTFSNLGAGSYQLYVKSGDCVTNAIPVTINPGPAFTATYTKTAVKCFGEANGSFTVIPANTSSPVQYSLDSVNYQAGNSFTGLAAGTYTAYFKNDKGCNGKITLSIDEPPALSATAQVFKDPTCFGATDGVLILSANGSVPPYTYSVNGGSYQANDSIAVSAGNYNVTVKDAAGCTVEVTNINVLQPAAIDATVTIVNNPSCAGGADGVLKVEASGGISPYTYALDNNNFQSSQLFNVAPGSYQVKVKDANGCSFSYPQPVEVTLQNNLNFAPLPEQLAMCEGTELRLDASQTNATNFAWTGTAISPANTANSIITVRPTQTTEYIVTASLGLCSINDTVLVAVNPAPMPDAGTDATICFGQDHILSAGPGMSRYEWNPVTYLTGNVSGNNPVVTRPDTSMVYQLHVMDNKGCHSLTPSSVRIIVTSPIIVTTIPSDTVAYFDDRFRVNAFSIGTIYTWSSPDGVSLLSHPDSSSTLLTVGKRDLTYKIQARTPEGCAGDTTITIKAYRGPEIYVATAFTPNRDGKNDLLRPFVVGMKSLTYFKVFNRQGQVVYSWHGTANGPVVFDLANTNIGWDGTLKGKLLTTETFVWIAEGITKDGNAIVRKGSSTLIR